MAQQELSDLERRMLDFAGTASSRPEVRDRAVCDEFGWTPTEYFYRLNVLLDQPAALLYAPQTVSRLRRIRDSRRQLRQRLRPRRVSFPQSAQLV